MFLWNNDYVIYINIIEYIVVLCLFYDCKNVYILSKFEFCVEILKNLVLFFLLLVIYVWYEGSVIVGKNI